MKHFYIIQSLCRIALIRPTDAMTHQVRRLRDAMEADGDKKEADLLTGLLESVNRPSEMAPFVIRPSYALERGEILTENTPIPVDKESSIPLAEVHFQDSLKYDLPIFPQRVSLAIQSVIDEWNHYDKLNQIDAQPSTSCLLYGLPGTGKTQLAFWMAQQMALPVIVARLDGLMSSYLGSTSRNIGNLFSFAKRYNCVLLLDEFDAIAKQRDDLQEVGEIKRVVNTLLQNLDSRQDVGITIGVTNHDSLLDPAIWRRFDVQFEIPNPTKDVMKKIISRYLVPWSTDEAKVKFLAWCINGGTGADAKNLVRWIKKDQVINHDSEDSLIDQMRKFMLVNSNRINSVRKEILLESDEKLLRTLIQDKTFGFKNNEVAKIFNMSPSSVSKKMSKN